MPLRVKDTDRFPDQLSLFDISQVDLDASIAAIVIAADEQNASTHQPNDSPTLGLRGSRNGGSLEASGQLQPALNQANEQLLETLYQLTIVQKMEYNAALEIALDEWSASPGPPSR